MTHPHIEELADVALDGSHADPVVLEHVAGCDACTGLVERLVAVRASAEATDVLVAPPAGVRDRVFAEIAGDGSPVVPLAPRRRRPGGVSWWGAGLAAAVALLAGVGIGRMMATEPLAPEAVDRGTVVAAADLTALDSDAPRGVAQEVRTDDSVTLRVSASGLGEGDGVHEVWLINVDGERMIALGLLASGDEGEFEVPVGLIDEGYRIVDISVEPDDGDPTHSGVSLARGELA